ncbi:hypothetical protein GWO60_08985 [Corynebacterium macginleyi]|nr:hypothetical protein [Corynebacterium macginleyi]MBK4151923.1 hypothetical protein [Corynebacterium macginleyi]MBK4162215.1 hypothetical protein [Corynebacterium macginleyi]MBK4167337.1 hypothetical protein [Corynebacterium macginleyi]MBK4174637.1 hypothetical protein [Corynebacterium macginleyi]
MTTGKDPHGCDYFTSLFLLPQLCNSTSQTQHQLLNNPIKLLAVQRCHPSPAKSSGFGPTAYTVSRKPNAGTTDQDNRQDDLLTPSKTKVRKPRAGVRM